MCLLATTLNSLLEKKLGELPVLPSVVFRLMGLNSSSPTHFDEVVRLLEAEPGYSVRILASANSAASAPTQPVMNLKAAIGRIGSRAAANLVLSMAVTRVFVPQTPADKAIWRHSLQVAQAARLVASHCHHERLDQEELYACGLLHDVGRLVMLSETPKELREVEDGVWNNPEELAVFEKSVFQTTHAEIGARACQAWKLPAVLVSVVQHHHDPLLDAHRSKEAFLAAIVRLVDFAMFSSAKPGAESLATVDPARFRLVLEPRVPQGLKVSMDDLRELIVAATKESEATAALLGLT